jgi:hypothetical protein
MPYTSRNTPPASVPEVTTRNRIARHLSEGFSLSFPAGTWRHLASAFADVPAITAEITRLRAELADIRLDRANLAAAALATIAAHSDGETDHLSYLRDELRAQGHTIRGRA